jgi:signal transduction histidine kinase
MISAATGNASDGPREPPAEASRRREKDRWLRRRRIERQLHDGAALRISALTLHLGLLRHREPLDEDTAQQCVDKLQDELHAVLEELRDVAAMIYPPLLDEAGLGPALRAVADQLGIPVEVVTSGERFGPAAEGAAYFAVARCLAALPSDAAKAEIVVRRENDELMVAVSGVQACHAELIHDQAEPLGGSVEVVNMRDGDRSGSSKITARIPCE